MKTFDWTIISKRIFINSDLESVYNSWTKSSELEKWFLKKSFFFASDGIQFLPSQNIQSNCNYEWSWFAQNHHESGTVKCVNGVDLIEFSFAGNCLVQVQLSKIDNQILVELIQSEIPEDDDSKENIRLGCAFGWTFYLLNLKSVLEGGIDLRNKDTNLIGVVNN